MLPPAVRELVQDGHVALDGTMVKARASRHTAEPVIGNLKDRNGLWQFVLRGLAKVAGEWSLACTAHHPLKLAAVRA